MINLQKAYKEFVEHLRQDNKSESTIIAYKKDIEQLIEHLEKQGLEMVHEINIDHLLDFMNKLAGIGLTNKTISRKTNATKTFFRHLKSNDRIQIDVAEQLKHPEIETKAPRILSKLEYKALRDTARSDERTFTMIEVLLQTGVSISELAYIETAHLEIYADEGTGHLHIPARESRRTRTVPLNKAVVEAIQSYMGKARPTLENAKHLFITKTGNPMLVRNIRSTIDRVFELAEVKGAKVNDLRHTFIAHHLSQGANLQLISEIVGHKRVSTTEKYLDHIEREVAEEKRELGIL
jgi:integrase/recombinase XerD